MLIVIKTKMRLSLLLLVFPFMACYGQNIEMIDSLSSSIIQNLYLESPDEVSSDSSLGKKKASLKAYPYVFYTPESKLAFGAGGIYIFYTGQSQNLKPSKIGFGGYYSTNKQYKISMNNVYYFLENRLYFELPLSYGYFINKFWGIGNDVPDSDTTNYAQQTFSATLTIQLPPELFSADRTGIIVDYDNTTIKDRMGNVQLEDPSVKGSNGGQLIGLGTDLLWDKRDHLFYPTKGNYQYFRAIVYPEWGDFVFAQFKLDARVYHKTNNRGVLAGNFYLESVVGDAPFYKLPSIGGVQMRGYFYGRYRDNFFSMIQLEHRQFFAERWGFVVFGTLGNVAEDILKYDFSSLKYSFGTGLRFKFNKEENVNLRADIGIGINGSTGIYFGIEEAF